MATEAAGIISLLKQILINCKFIAINRHLWHFIAMKFEQLLKLLNGETVIS